MLELLLEILVLFGTALVANAAAVMGGLAFRRIFHQLTKLNATGMKDAWHTTLLCAGVFFINLVLMVAVMPDNKAALALLLSAMALLAVTNWTGTMPNILGITTATMAATGSLFLGTGFLCALLSAVQYLHHATVASYESLFGLFICTATAYIVRLPQPTSKR